MTSTIAQKASEETQQIRRRLARAKVKRKEGLKWWLVYGPLRTGTSYMHQYIFPAAIELRGQVAAAAPVQG